MPRRRRPGQYLFVHSDMHHDPKVTGLPNDGARWAWLVTLAEAKKLQSGGRFANVGQYRTTVGIYSDHLDDLVAAGLLARRGDEVVVLNYEAWQDDAVYIDTGKAARDRRYRANHAAELAELQKTRRAAARSGDATGDVSPAPLGPPPPTPPTPPNPPTPTPSPIGEAEPIGSGATRDEADELESLAARYKRLIKRAGQPHPKGPVGAVIDAYRAIYGPQTADARWTGQIAALVRDHPYGAQGVVRDLSIAGTRDVGDPLRYVAGVVRATKQRQAKAETRGKGEQQDSDQYADVGDKAR